MAKRRVISVRRVKPGLDRCFCRLPSQFRIVTPFGSTLDVVFNMCPRHTAQLYRKLGIGLARAHLTLWKHARRPRA